MSSLPEHPHPTAKIGKAELLAALQNFLPADAILHSAEQLRPYECDGLSAYRQVPMLVVLPSNVEQVQQVLRLCYDNNVPVVARGAGTGLSGGALPLSDGVLLSLAKFNQILDIDTFNRTARVQPGVRNLAISEAAKPHGLYYAPDPSSQIACTIGGNVAENSGGVHCLKYGLTVHNILKLEIISIEGERPTIGSHALDGTIPLDDWLSDLRDKRAIARILVRLDRLVLGLEGQWRAVGEGIREIKIPEGKGYRVYYGWDGPSVVLLLCGGDKSTQRADIARAKAYWSDYHERK